VRVRAFHKNHRLHWIPLLFLLLLLPPSACTLDNPAEEREFISGPTNINAAVGNGGLTAALSSRGDTTVLRWPSPSYFDQLNYMTALLTPGARELPRMGSRENQGIFAGLAYLRDGQQHVTWFRDPQWTASQSYLSDHSNAALTSFHNPDLDLRVSQIQFILPDRDVLVFRYELTSTRESPVSNPSLIFFENASPCLQKVPNLLAVSDWLLDFQNDFAALYDARNDLLVHYRPEAGKELLSRLAPLYSSPPHTLPGMVERVVDHLDEDFGPGIYLAIGADRETSGHQVGLDSSSPCEQSVPWTYFAEDAFLDAQDGTLSGSPTAACQANAALQFDLDLSSGSDTVTLYLAASGSWDGPDGARAVLENARRETGPLDRTEQWWRDWISRARMPLTEDPQILGVAKRALISIKTATDRGTGAIVASVSTQPPYSLDWPRDGAFLNHILDRAGYHDMVSRHNRFYARVQRKESLLDAAGRTVAPAGTFATNYFADGMEGWPIPFEIDNAGLAAWTMAEHASFLHGEERSRYIREIWPAIRLTASELAACRDPENGLQCFANEGDSLEKTQGLVGAVAVYLALRSAGELGREAESDPSLPARWQSRAEELKQAVLDRFWNDEGFFETGFPYPRGFVSWVIWPARLLPYSDPRMESHARQIFSFIEPHLRKETDYALYDAEAVSALAHIWKGDEPRMEQLRWALDILTRELPTRGTRHYSEVYTVETTVAGRVFVPRTAVPHVWSAGLVTLAAMEFLGTSDEEPATASDGVAVGAAGCSCRTALGASPSSRPASALQSVLFLALLCPFWLRRIICFRSPQNRNSHYTNGEIHRPVACRLREGTPDLRRQSDLRVT